MIPADMACTMRKAQMSNTDVFISSAFNKIFKFSETRFSQNEKLILDLIEMDIITDESTAAQIYSVPQQRYQIKTV